jgi:hypothetical protein
MAGRDRLSSASPRGEPSALPGGSAVDAAGAARQATAGSRRRGEEERAVGFRRCRSRWGRRRLACGQAGPRWGEERAAGSRRCRSRWGRRRLSPAVALARRRTRRPAPGTLPELVRAKGPRASSDLALTLVAQWPAVGKTKTEE